MDYMIEMKKDTDSNLPYASVPIGTVRGVDRIPERKKKKMRSMVKRFLKKGKYDFDNSKWKLNDKETIVVKENPRVNSWKNEFGGKVYEGDFKIPKEKRREFNRGIKA